MGKDSCLRDKLQKINTFPCRDERDHFLKNRVALKLVGGVFSGKRGGWQYISRKHMALSGWGIPTHRQPPPEEWAQGQTLRGLDTSLYGGAPGRPPHFSPEQGQLPKLRGSPSCCKMDPILRAVPGLVCPLRAAHKGRLASETLLWAVRAHELLKWVPL